MSTDACLGTGGSGGTSGLVTGLLADTDCQAFGLVERGYAALSAPGSEASTMITALMVIAVALFGYQLMLGRGLSLMSVTGLVIRLGVVLLLAASWGTFQPLAYDTLARAPTRMAETMIAGVSEPAPLEHIQTTLDKIEAASIGWRQRAGIASPFVGGPPATAMTLTVSAFLLTIVTAGSLVVSRIVLALLLALTPLIAGFYLFNATRGLLEGWLRAIITAALVPVGVLVLTALELAIISPIVDRILTEQASGVFEGDTVTPLGLVVTVFSIAILAALAALGAIARGIRLPQTKMPAGARDEPAAQAMLADQRQGAAQRAAAAEPGVIRALDAAQRRESAAPARSWGNPARDARSSAAAPSGAAQAGVAGRTPAGAPGYAQPLRVQASGSSAGLRPAFRNRASRAARRRDR